MALSESGGNAPIPISYGTRGRSGRGKLVAKRGPVAAPRGPIRTNAGFVAPKSVRKGGGR
jgi:hypothetical protein